MGKRGGGGEEEREKLISPSLKYILIYEYIKFIIKIKNKNNIRMIFLFNLKVRIQ